MSSHTFKNLQTIKQAISNHLAGRTTIATFHFVVKFWATEIDLGADAQSIVANVDKLEAKMLAEHGWSRKDSAFLARLAASEG
jgi:DNA polymerase IIIc chi subunit